MSTDWYYSMANFQIIILLTIISLVLADELEFEELSDDVSRKMQDACRGPMPAGEVVVTPPRVVLPRNFKNYAQRIQDLEVRDSDVWLISFPKCGTTLAQEMIWLLKNNVDFDRAKSYLHTRFIFLEYKALNPEGNTEEDNIDTIESLNTPRLIKTHLPVDLLPKQIWNKNPKIIYLSRNPYDVAISYFHHFKLWNGYTGTQDLFLQAFVEDKVVYSPFWNHVISYWKKRNEKEMLFINFEDIEKDLAAVMKRVAVFLGVSYTPEQEAALLKHLSFDSMKNNKAVNFDDDLKQINPQLTESFIREGKTGGWKQVFSPVIKKRFEEWTEKYLTGSDLEFPRKLVENGS